MSDGRDLTMGTLKDDGFIDPQLEYLKMSKNKIERQRTFYIVLTLLIFILAVLIIAVFGLSFTYLKMTENQRQICTTEVCLKSATILVESMNKSVDPCEDFFQFACGRFKKFHKIPQSASSFDLYADVEDRISEIVRGMDSSDD